MAKVRGSGPVREATLTRHEGVGLSSQDVLDIYKKMGLVRTVDERGWALNRQGKVPIAASCQGPEAAQLGSLLAALKDGDCFLFPYYRDLAIKMGVGLTPLEVMLSFMGKGGEPYSGGRQFPLQGADLKHKIIQISNVVSAGLTQAVGYALGCRLKGDRTVVFTHFGDGGSSQGECHEAMNFAGVHKLPVVFICENNKYAISVPQTRQMAVEHVADRAAGYGFPGIVVDGMDIFRVFEATRDAIVHARSLGPVLLEMNVERFMPHTTDDDDRRYRPKDEIESIRKRDPLTTMQSYLIEVGLLSREQDEEVRSQLRAEVDRATDAAEQAPFPDRSTLFDHVYAA